MGEGEEIFEFTSAKHLDGEGEYEAYEPGFLKTTAHPDGLCLPCCFKTWDIPEQKRRKEVCEGTVGEEGSTRGMVDDYVQAVEKFPLPPARYGFMPLVLQRFFKLSNQTCQVSDVNPALRPHTPCLLRRGVQTNRLQSFLACIADAWKPDDTPSLAEMREHLASALTLSHFLTLQNGALALEFGKSSEASEGSPNEAPFGLRATTQAQTNAVRSMNQAYQAFQDWLRSDDSRLDHLLLWDLVSNPWPALWPSGINLVILARNANDITDNLRLLCPTNAYARHPFHPRRASLIL